MSFNLDRFCYLSLELELNCLNGSHLFRRISVIGKKFSGSTNCTEQWYGTEYSSTKLSENVLQVEFVSNIDVNVAAMIGFSFGRKYALFLVIRRYRLI